MGGTVTPITSLPQVPTPGALTSTLSSGGGGTSDPWAAFSAASPDVRRKAIRALAGTDKAANLFMAAPTDVQRRTLPHLIAAARSRHEQMDSAAPAFTPPSQGRKATAKDMADVAAHALPYVGAGAGAALADVGTGGFLTPALPVLFAGLGGATGQAAQNEVEQATGSPDAPHTFKEGLKRDLQSGEGQALLEGGTRAAFSALSPLLARIPIFRTLLSPEGQAARDINRRYKLRLTGPELTESVTGKKVQQLATIGYAGNIITQNAQKKGSEAGARAAADILAPFGPALSKREVGVTLRGESAGATAASLDGLYQKGLRAFQSQAGALKSKMAALTRDVGVVIGPNSPIIKWAQEQIQSAKLGLDIAQQEKVRLAESILRKVPDSQAPSKLVDASGKAIKLGDIPGATSHVVSFPELEAIREDIGAYTPPAGDVAPSLGERAAKSAYRAQLDTETQALQDSLSKSLSAEAKKSWEEYRDFYRTGIAVYQDKFGAALMTMYPEQVLGQLTGEGAASKLRVLNRGLDDFARTSPEAGQQVAIARDSLRQAYLRSTLESDDGKINPASLVGALKKLEKVGPEFQRELFPDTQSRLVLGNFKLLARTLAKRDVQSEYSGRFAAIELLLGGAEAFSASGGIGAGALAHGVGTVEGITALLSSILYSRRATEMALSTMETLADAAKAGKIVPQVLRGAGGVGAMASAPSPAVERAKASLAKAAALGRAARNRVLGLPPITLDLGDLGDLRSIPAQSGGGD